MVSGVTSFQFNEAYDAIDYTVEHIAAEELQTPFTAYFVWADGNGGLPWQFVLENGTPQSGAHSPVFLELLEPAGADAPIPVLADGLEVEPYPEGTEIQLALTIPFTPERWLIAFANPNGETTLRIPTLPADLDATVLIQEATDLHGRLILRANDGSVPGYYTAGSEVSITATWD